MSKLLKTSEFHEIVRIYSAEHSVLRVFENLVFGSMREAKKVGHPGETITGGIGTIIKLEGPKRGGYPVLGMPTRYFAIFVEFKLIYPSKIMIGMSPKLELTMQKVEELDKKTYEKSLEALQATMTAKEAEKIINPPKG
jgi:hypothetical protein